LEYFVWWREGAEGSYTATGIGEVEGWGRIEREWVVVVVAVVGDDVGVGVDVAVDVDVEGV
jgi:hypothetical protein